MLHQFNNQSRYRNPKFKLVVTLLRLIWFIYLLMYSISIEIYIQNNFVSDFVHIHLEDRDTQFYYDFVAMRTISAFYMFLYCAMIFLQVIRVIGIANTRFLSCNPDYLLGCPQWFSYTILTGISLNTFLALTMFVFIESSMRVAHPRLFFYFLNLTLTSSIVMFGAMRHYFKDFTIVKYCWSQNPVTRDPWCNIIEYFFALCLPSNDDDENNNNNNRFFRFFQEVFGHNKEITMGNIFDLWVLLRAYHTHYLHDAHHCHSNAQDSHVSESVEHFAHVAINAYGERQVSIWQKILQYIKLNRLTRQFLTSARMNVDKCGISSCTQTSSDESNMHSFEPHQCCMTGIHPEQLIMSSTHILVHKPRFFVFVEHERKAIVVAVSGTAAVADMVTDMEISTTSMAELGYPNHCAHSGILYSAIAVKNEMLGNENVRSFVSYYSSYEIVCCGHSLGAAVASLLALALHKHHHFASRKISAFAYGCPPCVSPDLAQHIDVHNIITCVLFDDDVISRTTPRNLKRLNAQMEILLHRYNKTFREDEKPLWWSKQCSKIVKKFINELHMNEFEREVESLLDSWTPHSADDIVPPGKILELQQRGECVQVVARERCATRTLPIIVSDCMVTHHLTTQYAKALQRE